MLKNDLYMHKCIYFIEIKIKLHLTTFNLI